MYEHEESRNTVENNMVVGHVFPPSSMLHNESADVCRPHPLHSCHSGETHLAFSPVVLNTTGTVSHSGSRGFSLQSVSSSAFGIGGGGI